MNRAVFVTAGLTLLALTGVSATDQWPQFRGSLAGVVADDPALPDTWSETENVVWKVPVPGLGWSSPVVWGDHIFITTAVNTEGPEELKPALAYLSRSVGGSMTLLDVASTKAPCFPTATNEPCWIR